MANKICVSSFPFHREYFLTRSGNRGLEAVSRGGSWSLEREQNPHKILNRKANRMARWQKSFIAREYYGVSQD
jgi:hypothetical protein